MEAFGEKLRRQREQRGITLEAISSSTKISTRMLRALEEEKFEQLPGGVFNKGFVRAYARQVGMDEEEAIADYLAALHESQIRSQAILPDLRTGKPAGAASEPLHHLPHAHEPAQEDRGQHEARSGVVAADENPIAPDRRRVHGRRDEDRRNEERRNQARTNRNRGKEDSRAPWQVENRPAADLLSAVHGEPNHDSARQPRMPIFATGTFGDSDKSSNSLPWITLAAALLLICVGLAFWNVHRHKRSLVSQRSEAASAALAPSQTSTPVAAPEPPVSKSPTNHLLKAKLDSTAATKPQKISAGTIRPAGTQTAAAAAPAPATHPLISQAAAINPAAGPSSITAGSITAGASSKAVSQPTAAASPVAFTLLIRAEKTSWVSITADGKLVAEETLIAPAEKSVRASNQVVVKAGNAAGVSFLWNAKEIPAQGKDGEVMTFMFDASGMKVSGNSQLPDAN